MLYITVSTTTPAFLAFVSELRATTSVVDKPITDLCHADARCLERGISSDHSCGSTSSTDRE